MFDKAFRIENKDNVEQTGLFITQHLTPWSFVQRILACSKDFEVSNNSNGQLFLSNLHVHALLMIALGSRHL